MIAGANAAALSICLQLRWWDTHRAYACAACTGWLCPARRGSVSLLLGVGATLQGGRAGELR